MAALGRKRDARQRRLRGEAATGDEEGEEDVDCEGEEDGSEEDSDEEQEESANAEEDGEMQYCDFGMSRNERRALREKGPRYVAEAEAEADAEEEGGHVDALPEELESIRLKRLILEKWLIEPFFSETVKGCLVRIGISSAQAGGQEHMLYRVAEVLGEKDFPDSPYTLGSRKTCKRLHLEFGETKQWYMMTSISNQPFDEFELRSWFQVREVCGLPQLSVHHLRSKQRALERASNFEYTEADVAHKLREEQKQASAAGKAPVLTTRQKLMAKEGFGSSTAPADLVARPLKMERNVLGQVFRSQRDEGE